MRKKLVVGNWKMNGSLAGNAQLLLGLAENPPVDAVDVAVCPPFVYLGQAASGLDGCGIVLGAQNLAAFAGGAYTGEISASMLRDLGCEWVIVGHSERRGYFGESDALVVEKLRVALAAGLRPIVCVGETLAQRESGLAEQVVGAQVDALTQGLPDADAKSIVLAYEPVWAIGTGRTATPEQAQEMHVFIRQRLSAGGWLGEEVRVLYGGSVTADNASLLFGKPDIDGALVGGASLVAGNFLAICAAAARVSSGI
ncbi:triose-phosphate isomerase [Zoogloea sp.]|uniref:triose-phosphate isomerase n=1 Tax=Zoogloea sp. TaxID=49181 RepID=UPI0014159520|nr:MAG: triose-phosphate isomerase [Zoogloea sp.]